MLDALRVFGANCFFTLLICHSAITRGFSYSMAKVHWLNSVSEAANLALDPRALIVTNSSIVFNLLISLRPRRFFDSKVASIHIFNIDQR